MMVASAIYLVMGLACLGNFHDAMIMGVGYLVLSACHYQGHRRE